MSDLLRGLNPEQLAAVTLPAQHALILAGAGSGKTRVLTTRIAWLIQTAQVGPHGVLAVTFTNKAAKEMLARLSAMLPINTRGMWIGTFHGLCNRLLRAHWREAALPQTFQILDSARPALGAQATVEDAQHRRREISAARPDALHQRAEGSRAASARGRSLGRLHPPSGRPLSRIRRAMPARRRGRFRRTAVAHLRSCWSGSSRSARTTRRAFATSWSTSSRTPTCCNTAGSSCSPAAVRR